MIAPLEHFLHRQGVISGKMSMLGFDDCENATLSALTDDLLGSSEIEGVLLNANSVRSSIARKLGIEYEGMLVEDHYVEGLVDVMFDAVKRCDEPLTAERLFGWHAALFPLGRSGRYIITVADWRKGEEAMQVVSGAMGHEKVYYEAPPSQAVASEMQRFMDWCNTPALSAVITAAIAHLWFVSIHPFDDGNGRISRTISDMFLSRLDEGGARYYSVAAEISRNKKEYYNILERTQRGNLDITEWLLWFISCLEKAIDRAEHTITRTLKKAAYWERYKNISINERQRKILNKLWDGFEGKLTSSKWAKICSCSQDTALRDINDLLAKGMLRDSGEGGRSANYLLSFE